ncbi:unnamed protein product, partial [Urochloa humidicola]
FALLHSLCETLAIDGELERVGRFMEWSERGSEVSYSV